MTDGDLKGLLELIFEEPEFLILPSQRAAASLLLEQHPELEHTFYDLLAKDSTSGSASVRDCFQSLINVLTDIMAFTKDENYWDSNYGENDSQPDELLIRAWAVGDVRGRLEPSFFKSLTDTEILDGFVDMRIMMYGDIGKPDRATDTDYWRGMAVLRRVYVEIDYEFTVHQKDEAAHLFAEWTGKHDDIAAVADVAMTRRTLDVDTIDAIISQAADTPALGDGAL